MLVCIYDYEIELRTPFDQKGNIVDFAYYMPKNQNPSVQNG